jgi:hypothetical protein
VAAREQGRAAARAGVRSVSVAVEPPDDAGQDGMEVVRQLQDLFDRHDLETAVHAAPEGGS